MASKNINVRVSGTLRRHLDQQVSGSGLYENASEYIRDLIRRDLKSTEEAWQWLQKKLEPGLRASDSEFVKVSTEEIIAGIIFSSAS